MVTLFTKLADESAGSVCGVFDFQVKSNEAIVNIHNSLSIFHIDIHLFTSRITMYRDRKMGGSQMVRRYTWDLWVRSSCERECNKGKGTDSKINFEWVEEVQMQLRGDGVRT